MSNSAKRFKNHILAALPKSEITRIARHLKPVTLEQSDMLLDGKTDFGYFLEDGIASSVVSLSDGETVEVGVTGIDGVVGIPIMLGTEGTPGQTFIQIPGSGYRIEAKILKKEFDRPSEFRELMFRYMQGFLVQTAQTAACNRLHGIKERLARWLLSCHDRIEGDRLVLTHDFLGTMLGAPRTTVTMAAGLLQRAQLIKYARGIVTVTDRKGLEAAACECYATVRDEFVRLKLL